MILMEFTVVVKPQSSVKSSRNPESNSLVCTRSLRLHLQQPKRTTLSEYMLQSFSSIGPKKAGVNAPLVPIPAKLLKEMLMQLQLPQFFKVVIIKPILIGYGVIVINGTALNFKPFQLVHVSPRVPQGSMLGQHYLFIYAALR